MPRTSRKACMLDTFFESRFVTLHISLTWNKTRKQISRHVVWLFRFPRIMFKTLRISMDISTFSKKNSLVAIVSIILAGCAPGTRFPAFPKWISGSFCPAEHTPISLPGAVLCEIKAKATPLLQCQPFLTKQSILSIRTVKKEPILIWQPTHLHACPSRNPL